MSSLMEEIYGTRLWHVMPKLYKIFPLERHHVVRNQQLITLYPTCSVLKTIPTISKCLR